MTDEGFATGWLNRLQRMAKSTFCRLLRGLEKSGRVGKVADEKDEVLAAPFSVTPGTDGKGVKVSFMRGCPASTT